MEIQIILASEELLEALPISKNLYAEGCKGSGRASFRYNLGGEEGRESEGGGGREEGRERETRV